MATISILDALPHELVERVLAEINPRDLCRCKQVCRWFNELIRTSVVLQWRFESLVEGVTYVGPPTASLQDRVLLFRQQQNDWQKLDWKRFGREAIEGPMNAYDHVGGIFGALSVGLFTTLHLPSKSQPNYVRRTRRLEFPARDFVLDQTQDVVIFLTTDDVGQDDEVSLQIFSFSQLKPHPEARVSQILVPINGNTSQQVYFMQLSHDVVGVTSRDFTNGLLRVRIWNWKQGKQLVDRLVSSCHQEGFTFLTPNIYLVTPVHRSGCISINSISPHKEIARLKLPNLARHALMAVLTLDTAPFFANPLEGRNFQMSPENRLYSMHLLYYHGQYVNWRAFMLAKTLLQYAKMDEEPGAVKVEEPPNHSEGATQAEDQQSSTEGSVQNGWLPPFSGDSSLLNAGEEPKGVRIIPWEEWGPDNVRMMDKLPHFEWHCFTDSSRVILPLPGHRTDVRVLDFNVPKSTVKRTTVIKRTSLFEEDIVSRLPYTSYIKPAPEDCKDRTTVSFMLDDERVVAIRRTQNSGYDVLPLAIN